MITRGPERGHVFELDAAGPRGHEDFVALVDRVVSRGDAIRFDGPQLTPPRAIATQDDRLGHLDLQEYFDEMLSTSRALAKSNSSARGRERGLIQIKCTALLAERPIVGDTPVRYGLDRWERDTQAQQPFAPIDALPESTPAIHHDSIVRRSRRVTPILLDSHSRTEPALTASLPAPWEPEAAAPHAAPKLSKALWRWTPVLLLGVLLLVVVAQAAVYLQAQQSIDELRVELLRREEAENKTEDSNVAERHALLQQIAGIVTSQQEAHLAQLDEQLRSRLNEQGAMVEQKLTQRLRSELAARPGEARDTASVASPKTTSASTDQDRPQAIFFVDCSESLDQAMPQVRDEIARELSRLETQRPTRILLLTAHDRLLEFSSDALDKVLSDNPAEWIAALSRQPSGFQDRSMIDHGILGLDDALVCAVLKNPDQLFILSDSFGGGSDLDKRAMRQSLSDLNRDKTVRIHAVHFFSIKGRESLRAIAREHGGTYSFISASK